MSSSAARAAAHPSRYNDLVLEEFAYWLPNKALVLDPFGGVGRLREITKIRTVRVEIEADWADCVVGDALHLPFADATFDAVATSPCYGNRMADHHDAQDASKRHTYKHTLGHDLHPHNAGALQWGQGYRMFHQLAWEEVVRVLRPDGMFLLNSSDHIRKGKVMHVTRFHLDTLQRLGLKQQRTVLIGTGRLRHGQNHQARVDHETVTILTKGAQP
jgi:SAM-dependent methyltransferase